MAQETEKLIGTIREAAKVLKVSDGTAYLAARRGEIPILNIGRRQIVQWQKFMRMVRGEGA